MISPSALPTSDFIIIHFADLTWNDAQLSSDQQNQITKAIKEIKDYSSSHSTKYSRVLEMSKIPWFNNVENLSSIRGFDLSNHTFDEFSDIAKNTFGDMVILKKVNNKFTVTHAVDVTRHILSYGLNGIQSFDEVIRIEHYSLPDASVWLVEIGYDI